jgi:hypothetical protein
MSGNISDKKLRKIIKDISEGKTDFNHVTVMPLVKEVLDLRKKLENIKGHIWDAACEAGYDIREANDDER